MDGCTRLLAVLYWLCCRDKPLTDSFAEYIQLCRAIAIGFVVMGFIGYFVKLIHIPM
jgi:preprotein translocase subunit Sss1